MGSNPATPTIYLFVSKGFILNSPTVSDAPKEERKGVKCPAGDAKVPRNVPRLFAGRSRRRRVKIFWRLAPVFAVLALALASQFVGGVGVEDFRASLNKLSARSATLSQTACPS